MDEIVHYYAIASGYTYCMLVRIDRFKGVPRVASIPSRTTCLACAQEIYEATAREELKYRAERARIWGLD